VARSDPSNEILDELGRLVRQLSRISGGAGEGPALTATQRLALFELMDQGEQRLNDLAARLGTSAPTASRAVDTLEEHGLVERRSDPDDRRALQIDLTPEGRRSVEERKARVYESFRPAAAQLSATERRRLAADLRKLADAVEAR
jgi:DNA-binding MarR family transcriptional regulator